MKYGPESIRHLFGFHPGTGVTAPRHERVREAYIAFGDFLDGVLQDGPSKDEAIKRLKESAMWANFGISELAPVTKQKNYLLTTPTDTDPIPFTNFDQ